MQPPNADIPAYGNVNVYRTNIAVPRLNPTGTRRSDLRGVEIVCGGPPFKIRDMHNPLAPLQRVRAEKIEVDVGEDKLKKIVFCFMLPNGRSDLSNPQEICLQNCQPNPKWDWREIYNLEEEDPVYLTGGRRRRRTKRFRKRRRSYRRSMKRL